MPLLPFARSFSYNIERTFSNDSEFEEGLSKPVVAIIRGPKEATLLQSQLSAGISLNYFGKFSEHIIQVQAAQVRFGDTNQWSANILSVAHAIVATFDCTNPEDFYQAMGLLLNMGQKSSAKCKRVMAGFNSQSASREDLVYYDLISCELECQFYTVERDTCGHQLSNLLAQEFPNRKVNKKPKKSIWKGLRKMFRRRKTTFDTSTAHFVEE